MKKHLLTAISALLTVVMLTAMPMTSCGTSVEPETPAPTNMGDVIFNFDGLIEGENASFTIGGIESAVEKDHYPIFFNGSVLPADTTFYYDGTTEPLVDICAVISEICGYSNISRGSDSWLIQYSFKSFGMHQAINPKELVMLVFDIGSDVVKAGGNSVAVTSPISMTIGNDRKTTIMLTYRDAAKVLGLETYFYGSEDVNAWGRDMENGTVRQTNGAPYYLSGTPHLMFWNYTESEGAVMLTSDEAVEIAREKLITAYEQKWGQYTPLSQKDSEAIGGDQGYFNEKIQELTVTSENDRFYRIPFMYDFLVDKYTGDVITQYNGMSEVFRAFDPYDEYALTFAG